MCLECGTFISDVGASSFTNTNTHTHTGMFAYISKQEAQKIETLECKGCEEVGQWMNNEEQQNRDEKEFFVEHSSRLQDRSDEILLVKQHEIWMNEEDISIESPKKKPTFTKLFGSTRRLKSYNRFLSKELDKYRKVYNILSKRSDDVDLASENATRLLRSYGYHGKHSIFRLLDERTLAVKMYTGMSRSLSLSLSLCVCEKQTNTYSRRQSCNDTKTYCTTRDKQDERCRCTSTSTLLFR